MNNYWLDKKEANISDVNYATSNDDTSEMMESYRSMIEEEYNKKLEEAYSELSNELLESEKVAEKGYEEAWKVIADLQKKLKESQEMIAAAHTLLDEIQNRPCLDCGYRPGLVKMSYASKTQQASASLSQVS